MITATFSEFRHHAKQYFDAVEQGERIEIFRHGKPIAMICPISTHSQYWQSVKPVMELTGVSVSQVILDDRDET
jgi:prevent-host-death family protein